MNSCLQRFSYRLIGWSLLIALIQNCGLIRHSQDERFSEYEYIGKVNPKESKDIESSQWGIQMGTLEEEAIRIASTLGVKWTRLQASWSSIEKEKGKFDFSRTDSAFASALDNGITPFVTIGGSNKAYTGEYIPEDPKLTEIYGIRPAPPTVSEEALESWLFFVDTTVNRYKDQIQYWEVWNEPNHFAYWGGPPDGKEYGRLLYATAKLIRELQPDAKILGGSMAGLDPEFTEDFLSLGTGPLLDIITYHHYGIIPENRIYPAVATWEIINRYNPKIEMWQGECGYPSHSSTSGYRSMSPWGLNIQAKWLLRQSFTDIYFCNASMSNYFKLVHRGDYSKKQPRSFMTSVDSVLGVPERAGSRVRFEGVNEKCLISHDEWEPKPAFYAYQNLCAVLDHRYKTIATSAKIDIEASGVFSGIGPNDDAFPSIPLLASFQTNDGKTLFAYWLPWQSQEYLSEFAVVSLSAKDIDFKEPVLINPLSGEVFKVEFMIDEDELRINNLPLADFPFIIAEREEIDVR